MTNEKLKTLMDALKIATSNKNEEMKKKLCEKISALKDQKIVKK